MIYAVRDSLRDPLVGDPVWSPDASRIYFKSHDMEGRASFWAVSPSGGAPRLLVIFDDPALAPA